MADTPGANSENIGAIDVSIGADYSPLQAAFSAAQDQAEKAGQEIASSFNDGVASIADSAQTVGDALDGISGAADEASSAIQGEGSAAEEAGNQSEGAASQLGEMAEQMLAIGEALVITEGLKELGQEALAASDSITTASIALTTMTGDAGKATDIIDGLEKLGMADGLAMPSLLTAAQRMTQMLPPGTDVVSLLGNIADGAAAMGTDVASAADRFDMLVNATSLGSRGLSSMGLSLTQVITAMGQVTGATDVTVSNLSAMWKALDPGTRVEVLQTALQGLGGTAEQVANQTFGGQWQQLANAWEEIMVQVGQAILPVISDLVSLAKTDILPFVEEMVADFNELPGPVKDTAVAVAIAVAALVPLTGGLAAIGLALNGLEGLLPAVTGLLETFGAASSEVAAEETAAAAATEAVGVAAEGAGIAATGLAAIVGITLVSGLAAAAFGFTDLNASLKSAQSGADGSEASFAQWLTTIDHVNVGAGDVGTSVDQLNGKLATLKTGLDIGAVSATQYATAVGKIQAALDAIAKSNMQASVDGWTSGLHILGTTADTASTSVDNLGTSLGGLSDKDTTVKDSLASIDTATANTVDGMGNLASAADVAGAAADAQGTKLGTLSNALITAQQKLVNTDTAVKEMTNDVNAGLTPLSDLVTMEGNLQKAADAVTKAQTAYDTAAVQAATDASNLASVMQTQQITALQDLATSLGPALSQMTGLNDLLNKLQSAVPGFGVQVVSLSSGPIVGLESALAEATSKLQGWQDKLNAGEQVGLQYDKALTAQLNAQVALNVATAEAATGLQGESDAVALATIAVAAAQAKFDTLNAAFQTNITLAPQVSAAQTALTNAQKNLTTAQNAGTEATNALTTAGQNLAAGAPAVVTAMGNITAVTLQQLSAMNNLAPAIQSVENDFNNLMGAANSAASAASSASGSFGAPSGYYASFSGGLSAFGQQVVFYPTPETAAKQLYADGYTPAQIAKEMQQPLSQVLTWLGVSASASNTASASSSGNVIVNGPVTGLLPGGSSTTSSTGTTGATETLAQAEAGVTAAQNAITAAMASSATTAAQMGELMVILAQAQDTLQAIEQGNTSTTAASTSSTTPITTSSTGSGTGAVDGGSYPAVTAHQAAGEIWAVSGTAGTATGGAGAAVTTSVTNQISETISNAGSSSTGALESIAESLGPIELLPAALQNALQPITASLSQIAGTIVEKLVGTGPVDVGGSKVSGAPISGGGGTTVGTGPINTNPDTGYYPTAPTGTTQNSIPGYNPFGPSGVTTPSSTAAPAAGGIAAQVTVDMRNSNFGGATQTQMINTISAAVTQSLVQTLRASGARF